MDPTILGLWDQGFWISFLGALARGCWVYGLRVFSIKSFTAWSFGVLGFRVLQGSGLLCFV